MTTYCQLQVTDGVDDYDQAAFDLIRDKIQNAIDSGASPYQIKSLTESEAARIVQDMGVKRHTAAMSALRYIETLDYVQKEFADYSVAGVKALLVGEDVARPGARLSVAAQQEALKRAYVASMFSKLEQSKLNTLFASGTLDEAVAIELWGLSGGTGKPVTKSRDAFEIAKIIREAQDQAKNDFILAGGYVRDLPGWIVRQSHDQYKITAAGYNAWAQTVEPLLDWGLIERLRETVGKFDRQQWLREAYRTLINADVDDESLVVDILKDEAGKRFNEKRILHFKGPKEWHAYNKDFGAGNLRESVMSGLRQMSDTTGMMNVLGPSPKYTLNKLINTMKKEASDKGDFRVVEDFNKQWAQNGTLGKIAHQYAATSGEMNMAISHKLARYSSNVRSFQILTKLGGMIFSMFSDVPIAAAGLRHNGKGFLQSYAEQLQGILGRLKGNDKKVFLAELGMISQSAAGNMTRALSGDVTISGRTQRMMDVFFKYNLSNWWTDSMKNASAMGLGHGLATVADQPWGKIGQSLQRKLSLYGIDEAKWDIIRLAPIEAAEDGTRFVTSETVRRLPDDVFDRYAQQYDPIYQKAETAELKTLRREQIKSEIVNQVRMYFADQGQYAVLEAGPRARAAIYRGTRAGTEVGEALRFLMQFKSFMVEYHQRVIRRGIYGYGRNEGLLRNTGLLSAGANAYRALAAQGMPNLGAKMGFVMQLMLFGYLTLTTRDLSRGKEPRDPLDPATWAASLVQAGGLGVFADIFKAGWESNEFGKSPVETLAGPTVSTAVDAVQVASAWAHTIGGDTEPADALAKTFKLGVDNVPFGNLFYARSAANYLFVNSVMEELNPGFLRRMERRQEELTEQEYWLPPSEQRLIQ